MAAARKRLKGVVVEKPFVYGSVAFWLGKKAEEQVRSHSWTVYVRGVDHEDLSYLIKKVVFQLHPSFENPTRVVESAPFEVNECGWGEFAINMTVHFQDPTLKPVTFSHMLKLFPAQGMPQSAKKPVVCEYYDQWLFIDPTEELHALLQTPPPPTLHPHPLLTFWSGESEMYGQSINSHNFSQLEARQLQQVSEAQNTVYRQLAMYRNQLATLEAEMAVYREQLAALGKNVKKG
eukprot:TRINITY_DN13851_c0_g1_i3.p1 TRINITY_DN13851_c0_g1~~TRINITY_DN13851_c0_g1_i3.p1  ORF type:complete len:234 (-),score=46.84 TRINITY_DN13851_c0_g1_i3:92-793(-)